MWCARLSELVLPWTRVRNGRKSRSAPTTRAKQADKTGQGYAQPWKQGNCRRLLTHNPLAHRHPLVHSPLPTASLSSTSPQTSETACWLLSTIEGLRSSGQLQTLTARDVVVQTDGHWITSAGRTGL